MGGSLRDLTGQRFGRLQATSLAPLRDNNHAVWNCQCDCGKALRVRSSSLVCGQTQSCGCLAVDMGRSRQTTHNMSHSPTYHSWKSMHNRCKYPKHPAYSRYGGAGIAVCPEWDTFAGFLADMGVRPEGTTLDRVDNSQGYNPSNCRWANWKVQARNKQKTEFLDVRGISLAVAEWGEVSGVSPATIRNRLHLGVDPLVCVFYPAKHGTRLETLQSKPALEQSVGLFENWKLSNPNVFRCVEVVRATWEKPDAQVD